MLLTIRNHDAVLAFNSLVSHSLGQIHGQQNGIHLPAQRIERRLEQN